MIMPLKPQMNVLEIAVFYLGNIIIMILKKQMNKDIFALRNVLQRKNI